MRNKIPGAELAGNFMSQFAHLLFQLVPFSSSLQTRGMLRKSFPTGAQPATIRRARILVDCHHDASAMAANDRENKVQFQILAGVDSTAAIL
jgi:hypothetical protein